MSSFMKRLRRLKIKREVVSLIIVVFLFLFIGGFFYLSQTPLRRVRNKAETALSSSIQRENDVLRVEFIENYPLKIDKPIYRFSIDGNISLKTNKSFIRVVLVDSNKDEHLVYEAYPLIIDNNSLSTTNGCDETCVMDSITPVSLRISGYRTSFSINKTSFIDSKDEIIKIIKSSDLVGEQQRLKKEKDNLKITKINENINKKGLKWIAGETSVSQKTYAQKKKMFSNPDGKQLEYLPNLQGFEYYVSGIFEIFSDEDLKTSKTSLSLSSPYPVRWDWRNAHGENWMTSVKDQDGCGSCWAFAATGATEGVTNVYFNQHLNYDLSEQDAVSCSGAGGCNGGSPSLTLDYYRNVGVADEACFPYQARDVLCQKCSNWQNRVVKISGREDFSTDENWLKEKLLKKGPISGGILSWGHAMALVGWDTDLDENETIWIFKNSWGQWWGENGYVRLILPINDIYWTHAINSPVVLPTAAPITCVDKDYDGYCNWGISETRPASCPASCRYQKDCDDSNPNSGYFDSNFNCAPCGPNNCSGCCLHNVCHLGTASQTCGAGGQTCTICGGNQMCQSGSCVSLPPTPVISPNERCALSVIGGLNHAIGETIQTMVRQRPKFADNGDCYYQKMRVVKNGQFVCTASGFSPGSQTRVCSWNTSGLSSPVTYSLSSFYGGHGDGCPDNPCCDNTYTCNASVVLSSSAPTPTRTPTPTPTPKTCQEMCSNAGYNSSGCWNNCQTTCLASACRTHVYGRTFSGTRDCVVPKDTTCCCRNSQPLTCPAGCGTTNYYGPCACLSTTLTPTPTCPPIQACIPAGGIPADCCQCCSKQCSFIFQTGENICIDVPTITPTPTCTPNGGNVSNCSQCCSNHCETNPLGPTICIP